MSKVCELKEAVAAEVEDGASVAMGCGLESLIPFAAGYEIIRQNKKDLTLIGPISDMQFDQIIGAGCVKKVVAAWVGNVAAASEADHELDAVEVNGGGGVAPDGFGDIAPLASGPWGGALGDGWLHWWREFGAVCSNMCV